MNISNNSLSTNNTNKIKQLEQLNKESTLITISDISTHEASEDSNDEQINIKNNELQEDTTTSTFKEKVIKFIKIDNSIRNKKMEIKELKKELKPCEEYLISYLDSKITDPEVEKSITIDKTNKLTKKETKKITTITKELIVSSIMNGLHNFGYNDENTVINITNDIITIIEKKRAANVKTLVSIKRSIKNEKKKKDENKKRKNNKTYNKK